MLGMDELKGLYHFIYRSDEVRINIIKTVNKNVQNNAGQIKSSVGEKFMLSNECI